MQTLFDEIFVASAHWLVKSRRSATHRAFILTSSKANVYLQPPTPENCDQRSRSTVLLDFLLTVKAATLIFISGRGSAIEGKSGFVYNLVKSR